MTKTISAVKDFISTYDCEPLAYQNLHNAVEAICCNEQFRSLLLAFINSPAFSEELGKEFAMVDAVKGLSAARKLRSCLNLSLSNFFGLLAELLAAFNEAVGTEFSQFANRIHRSGLASSKLLNFLLQTSDRQFYQDLAESLVAENPHAVYPTSNFRESRGFVESTSDDQIIEAVVRSSTFTSVRVIDNSLDTEELTLRNMYVSH